MVKRLNAGQMLDIELVLFEVTIRHGWKERDHS
jgi:hypothetical protein